MEHAVEKFDAIAPHAVKELQKKFKEVNDVEQVYLSPDEEERLIITVLVKENCLVNSVEKTDEIEKAVRGCSKVRYRIYGLPYAEQQIEEGNLYFIRNCCFGTLIHRRSSSVIFAPEIEKIETLLKKAATSLENEIERINSFTEGIIFYRKRKEWAGAAFLIHQKLEWLYRCMETFAMGKSLICHKIKNHLTYAHPFIFGAGPMINTERRVELHLLEVLDRAYTESRYHSTFDITKKEVKILDERAQLMENQVREIFSFRMNDCLKLLSEKKERFSIEIPKMENNNLIEKMDDDQAILKKTILQELDAIKIISFGKRTGYQERQSSSGISEIHSFTHHDLLILVNDSTGIYPSKISNLIIQKTGGKLATTIIITSTEKVKQALKAGNIFLLRTLKEGKEIFSDPQVSLDVQEILITKEHLEKIRRNFLIRQSRAHGFLRATSEVEGDDDATELSLQYLALQQICLGSIYVMLGLRPDNLKLKYLLDLCSNFSDAPNHCFPRKGEEDQRLFKKLMTSIHEVRFRTSDQRSLVDVDILLTRTHTFLKEMESIVEKKMTELEKEFKQQDHEN